MKQTFLTLFFVAGLLQASADTTSPQPEDAPAFDRATLIPLDKALPESAKPHKPDYSVRRTEPSKEPARYTVVYSSSVGAEPQAINTNNDSQAPAGQQTASFVHPFTTPTGETVYLPIQVPLGGTTMPAFIIPSKATYKIVERH